MLQRFAVFALRYPFCSQTRRIPKGGELPCLTLQTQARYLQQGSRQRPDVDMVPILSRITEQQKGVCVGTWGSTELGTFSYCLQLSFPVR